MKPGPTLLTRMPCGAYSIAAVLVMPTTPCLADTYATDCAKPTDPRIDAMFTIAPPPPASIAGISARRQWKTPLRFTAMTAAQPSSGYSPVGACGPPMPALLTATSSRPNLSTAAPTIASHATGSATSTTCARAASPMAEATR